MLLNLHAPDDMPALLRSTAPRPGPAGPECLDEETIAAVVDGTLDSAARGQVTQHLSECARCRSVVAGVARVVSARPVAQEVHRAERGMTAAHWRWRVPVGLAAAAAIALLLLRPGGGDTDRTSDARRREPALTTTVAPVPAGPRGTVVDGRALRWSSVPNADRYRVRLFAADGTVLWESEITDTAVAVPVAVVLQTGVPYFWKVEARTGWDRWVASDLVEFRIEPLRR